MLKHVIVEQPLADRLDEFVACGLELRALMRDRGWRPYTAWRSVAGDEGEPPMFDVGILGRPTPAGEGIVVFEGDFADRDQLEAQLHAMRNDPEVVKLLVRAMQAVDTSASRAYILEDWWPDPLAGEGQ